MKSEHTPTEDGRRKRPNALYSINNEKTAAGLDALLHAGPEDLEELSEFLSLNRVILGNGGFCMLIAKVQYQPDHGVETLMDANGLFAEQLEERLVQKAIYYMVPIHGLVLCLVAMPQYRQNSRRLLESNERLCESGIQAMKQFQSDTGMETLLAVSPICFGLDSLPGTFQRTLDLLEFHAFFGQTAGVCRSPISLPKRPIRLSSEFQTHCANALNLLLAGQREAFFSYVKQSLEGIKALVPSSLQQYKTLSYQYLDMLCCFLVDHQIADAGVLERTDLFWLVHEPRIFADLCQRVAELLMQLTNDHVETKKHANARMVETVKVYFQNHHTDHNLTVSGIAAEFQMTQPVFSAYFIKQIGVGPLEYLNKLRVQTAMELLKTTEDILPQIAQRSGFGSVSTMHRIFKKMTGMTPAQVRNGVEARK